MRAVVLPGRESRQHCQGSSGQDESLNEETSLAPLSETSVQIREYTEKYGHLFELL